MNISLRTLSMRALVLGLVCALWGIPQASARTRTGNISGHVLGVEGKPLALAGVRLMGTQRGAHTDSLGAFTLKRLRPGTYSLLISYVGYHPDTVAVTVRARSVTDITATLVVRPVPLDTIIVRTERAKLMHRTTTIRCWSSGYFETTTDTTVRTTDSTPVPPRDTNGLSIRGRRRAIETTIRVEGIEVPDPYCDGHGDDPSEPHLTVGPFAVEEVNAGGLSAEYGNVLNGIVTAQSGATQC